MIKMHVKSFLRCDANRFKKRNLEKYSSGRRGAPAKGIGRVTGARVQIPPSPFYFLESDKKIKKVVDKK